MNAAEFDDQFNRLKQHFHAPSEAETVSLEWFKALEHYHVDALERGVTHLIRASTDRFWPALGKLRESIQGRMAGLELVHSKCLTCHGNRWIDSAPFWSNGMIYDSVSQRCPDCGTPAPEYQNPHGRRPLTAVEYATWARGEDRRQYMPEGLEAHPETDSAKALRKAETLKSLERLRAKLFGKLNPAKLAEARQSQTPERKETA